MPSSSRMGAGWQRRLFPSLTIRKGPLMKKGKSPKIITKVRSKDYMKVQIPSFHPDPEIIFSFPLSQDLSNQNGKKKKVWKCIFFVLVLVGSFTNHKIELFKEKESLTTLNVNAPILCIQLTEMNYAADWNADKCFYQKATPVIMSGVNGLQSTLFKALACSISTALYSQMLCRGLMSKILGFFFVFFLTIPIYLQLWKPLYQDTEVQMPLWIPEAAVLVITIDTWQL